ncbi:phosphatidic acid phosphatase type 2/haloperoxidase [Crassisporium funariophilum]|nr:phosphatidic acid phosphatase type 2/haloperoxidase [Crassisporium funariophilum]
MSYTRINTPLPRPQQPSQSFAMRGFPFKPTEPLAKATPMSPARRRKLLFSYAPDWILTIVLAILFLSLDKVDGYRRVFSLEDTSLRHPYAVHERVPNLALYLICGIAPFVIMSIVNFITVRSWWDFHNGTLGLVLGLALTGSFTQIVKITVGRPRPDILDRCQPPPGLSDPAYSLSDWTICTQLDGHILRDGFRSFPSGHSSLSFAGLGFLAFYLAGKLHLFDSRGQTSKAWLALSPFMAAALVAVSRTMDYRHHWHDVLVGSLLGTALAFFSYHQYYPSLASPLSHRPYSPRIKRDDNETLPSHTTNNPFVPSQSNYVFTGNGSTGRYNDSSFDDHRAYELGGTVPRPGPGSLEHVWQEGSGESGVKDVIVNPSDAYGGIVVPLQQPNATAKVPPMRQNDLQ